MLCLQAPTSAPSFQEGRGALTPASEGSNLTGAAPPPSAAQKGKPRTRCSGAASSGSSPAGDITGTRHVYVSNLRAAAAAWCRTEGEAQYALQRLQPCRSCGPLKSVQV